MSTKQIEALKLALEVLEAGHSTVYGTSQAARAITAIREALADSALDRMAENARELGLDYGPIVEQVEDSVGMGHKAWDMVDPEKLAEAFDKALTEPPCKTGSQCTSKCQQCEQPAQPRKPLTEEEIEFIYADTGYNDIQMFARAIEAAHGIKEPA